MKRKNRTINHSQVSNYEEQTSHRYAKDELSSSKLPSANVNEGKLKIVLQQLKKANMQALHTSR